MKKTRLFSLLLFLCILVELSAKEGMWLPVLIEKYNYADMQTYGLKISAEEIFSINQASLKDAIVIFGQGCTGEIISGKGLLLTNHHCSEGQIQRHSSVGKNYLNDGFWAMNQSEELPNPGLSVKFLVRMEDFTSAVLDGIDMKLSFDERTALLREKIAAIEKAVEDTSDYLASVEGFFEDMQFYLFLYNEYNDVRLVGTPPESIGNFGGDTDNWVWPRHTCDFTLFRVYSSPDGKPADYSPANIPLKPLKSLTISARGVQENDFTMVLGYPGYTSEYLYSGQLELINETIFPNRIRLRDGRLEIINKARAADESVYIQYATDQSRIANAWKKWKGVLYGFERFRVIEKRQDYEKWLLSQAGNKSAELQELYELFDAMISAYTPYYEATDYFSESVMQVKPFTLVRNINNVLKANTSSTFSTAQLDEALKIGRAHFNALDVAVDKQLTGFLLSSYQNDMDQSLVPASLLAAKQKGGIDKYVGALYTKSVFTDSVRFRKAIELAGAGKNKMLIQDPVFKLYSEFVNMYLGTLANNYDFYTNELDDLNQQYLSLIMTIDTVRPIYPDANFTMRITYGKVHGYSPSDAVEYNYQTYLDGLIEKSETGIEDYQIPEKLKDIYQFGDFGKYADENGKLPLCFVASNHTSGGNSGSPVLNANGQLIGINFDRTWEGTMSDFYFDEQICRNIAVDIRYVLFIIDKFAGAGYLLDEMNIVW